MPKITMDGIEYNSEDLSDNGEHSWHRFSSWAQMNKLKAEIAVYQTHEVLTIQHYKLN